MKIKEILSRIERCLTEPERNPKDIRVIIDAGHGGKDSGAVKERSKVGLENVLEEDINLEVANQIAWLCARHQIGYLMTRWGDRYISLKERCKRANMTKAKLFLSIHCNAVKNPKAKGIEIWYLSAKSLAMRCLNRLNEIDFTKNRGIKKGRFRVLRKTRMKAILIELGFISNKEDMKFLIDENNQTLIAEKIFEFIREICK